MSQEIVRRVAIFLLSTEQNKSGITDNLRRARTSYYVVLCYDKRVTHTSRDLVSLHERDRCRSRIIIDVWPMFGPHGLFTIHSRRGKSFETSSR